MGRNRQLLDLSSLAAELLFYATTRLSIQPILLGPLVATSCLKHIRLPQTGEQDNMHLVSPPAQPVYG